MNEENEVKPKGIIRKIFGGILKLIVIAILLVGIWFVLKIAPNYVRSDIADKTNLIINFSNVTNKTKQDLLEEENGIIYLSLEDIKNYYDDNIYYDEQYNQIVTSSENKLAVLRINEDKMTVNGEVTRIKGKAKNNNGVYYVPISDMEEIYNIKITKADNRVIIESLDNRITTAKANKNLAVKYKATFFSRTLEKVNEGEKLTISETEEGSLPEGWCKVRTKNGAIGYVEKADLVDMKVEKEETTYTKKFDGKISLAWDYYSEYGKAPDNTGIEYDGVNVVSPSFFNLKLVDTGKENLTRLDVIEQAKLLENVGDEGINYINWAKAKGYEIWPKVTNDTISTTIDEFSCIINDYEMRRTMIKDIVNYVKKYNLDGINLDFEYMYQKDNEAFSRFVIELAPQLRDIGARLSVDVTAPYGSSTWSLCYNRKLIGEVADYVVFMGYDQNGTVSIGTTSSYVWVKNSIKNFIGPEEVPAEKIILGLPFYTKVWQTKNGETIKGSVVSLKNMDSAIPANSSKEWLEDARQYYVQYEDNGFTYKIWVEDEKSFGEKISLVDEYNLAGAAYWRKGFDSDSIWTIIKKALKL